VVFASFNWTVDILNSKIKFPEYSVYQYLVAYIRNFNYISAENPQLSELVLLNNEGMRGI